MNQVDIEKFKVDPSDFKPNTSKPIINGLCRTISFVTQEPTSKKCVLKKTNDIIKKSENLFNKEIEILSTYRHPAIVPFIGFYISDGKLNIYLKEMEKGSLQDVITKNQRNAKDTQLDDTHKLIISYGISCAMKYLHSFDIIHQNLKPTNILLDSEFYPYITDFESTNLMENITDQFDVKSSIVSFMAPEIFEDYMHCNHAKSIDIYSYGMILYYLWTELSPYPSDYSVTEIIQRTLENNRPEFPESPKLNDTIKDLIRQCWSQDPKERPTFSGISDRLQSTEFLSTQKVDLDLFNKYKAQIESSPKNDSLNSSEIKNSMDLLKKFAASGNSEAQNLLALHLYNGFNVQKDRSEAARYFKLAAENGLDEARFWLSLTGIREGKNVEEAASELAAVASKVPEAQSILATQLAGQEGNLEEAERLLISAAEHGLITAVMKLSTLRAKKSEVPSDNFTCEVLHSIACDRCHCMDSAGFFFPVERRVFRCEECNIEVCDACACHCHKGHTTVEIGSYSSFTCGCGRSHFGGRCSFEYVGESDQIHQHFFSCMDCCGEKTFFCRSCAEKCHKGHRVVDVGVMKGFCACGANKLNKDHRCQIVQTNTQCRSCGEQAAQRWFQCVTCGFCSSDEDGVCIECATKCHKGHILFDRGVRKERCRCCKSEKCKLEK